MKFTICTRTMTVLIAGALAFALPAQAQTFSVLHTFTGGEDGANPYAGLIRDSAGNLYGATYYGGASQNGVVFKLDTAGNETVLHSFTGRSDGKYPYGGLIRDTAGNLYGTTVRGGDLSCYPPIGCGVVFKLDTAGNETVLHSFTDGADGANPGAGLIPDTAGNLYGTNYIGGDLSCFAPIGCGVVFKLDTNTTRTLTVLHSFTGGADGAAPYAGLIRDAAGNLYGTTYYGGDLSCYISCGVVFKLDTAGNETVLYSFTAGADGANTGAGLIRDATGNLYGTTSGGGGSGYGTVFKLDPTGKETVLYSFTGGDDGRNPYAGLVRDAAGNLYGTAGGGANQAGTVFKLDKSGKETVLYSFTGRADGLWPVAGLIRDTAGNLYGTTTSGGTEPCSNGQYGCGTVFKLTP